MKKAIWFGMVIGSTVGGMIPELWGAGLISFSSILLSGVGAMIGIFVAFKMIH